MSRNHLLYGLIALLLLGLAHGLYWNWSAGQIEARVAEWREEQRHRGFQIDFAGPAVGGYPTGFAASFREPRVTAPDGWRWAGPEVTGRSALWTPFTIAVAYPGRHEISREGQARAVEVELAAAETEVGLRTDGQVERLHGRLRDGAVRGAGEVWKDLGEVTFESLSVDFGPLVAAGGETPQRAPVLGEVTDVELPEIPRNPLGRQIARVALDGTLVGEIDGGEPRAALGAWRDAGGHAEVRALEAEWGPMGLTGSGRLTIDEAFRPAGELETKIRGLDKTIDALARQGLIEPGVVLAARLGLAVLPKERDAEGREVVPLPVTLRDGLLYVNFGVGPVPLLRLDPVL